MATREEPGKGGGGGTVAPSYMADIYDGRKWKNMKADGWFRDASDLAITSSTDGGALFKSCGVQAWPV